MKNIKKVAYFTIVLSVLFIIGGCSLTKKQNKEIDNNIKVKQAQQESVVEESVLPTETSISNCSKDEDCIVVPYDHCCGLTKKVINKKYLDEYNSHPEWQKFDDPTFCENIGQCLPDTGDNYPSCNFGVCALTWR